MSLGATKRKGIGGHHRAYKGANDEWLTPPEIIKALGEFDLDPCSPVVRPWDTAKWHWTKKDDGLGNPWPVSARIWINPPYGPETKFWLKKLADHGNGIALIFARTDVEAFHRHVFERAQACLFLEGRLSFYDVNGKKAKHNSGGPSVLVAYGMENVVALRNCGLKGYFVNLYFSTKIEEFFDDLEKR